jgi:hypothetical protein
LRHTSSKRVVPEMKLAFLLCRSQIWGVGEIINSRSHRARRRRAKNLKLGRRQIFDSCTFTTSPPTHSLLRVQFHHTPFKLVCNNGKFCTMMNRPSSSPHRNVIANDRSQLDKLVGLGMLVAASVVFLYYTIWTLLMVRGYLKYCGAD